MNHLICITFVVVTSAMLVYACHRWEAERKAATYWAGKFTDANMASNRWENGYRVLRGKYNKEVKPNGKTK